MVIDTLKDEPNKIGSKDVIVQRVEITDEKRCFLITIEKRDSKTIQKILNEYIEPELILYTDCWREYNGIEDGLNVQHKT
ncbi:22505_t:CDS:2, partial [Dentiscutata erythropus]